MRQDPRIKRALDRFDGIRISNYPPQRLPLLDKFRKAYPEPEAFFHVDALFVQHHLGPFVPRVETMKEDGLAQRRCWFIDIPYSTNNDARERLIRLGWPKDQAVGSFNDPLVPYSRTQLDRVAGILRQIANREEPRPFLVVDDGAYFVRTLNELRRTEPGLVEAFRHSRVVEQTTRGHRYLVECGSELIDACGLAVVSIARCHTKTYFESPFIGAAVSRGIVRALRQQNDIVDRLRHIAVLGFGPVGEATTLQLSRLKPNAEIDVVEPDNTKHGNIKAAGGRPLEDLPEELPDHKLYDLVAGCTGYNSFKLHQRSLLADNAVLASGSSAAVEFNRAGFVELADKLPDDEIEVMNREETIAKGIHATITLQQEGRKRFSFLNAGFPVNFDGRIECLPTKIIQATHCLLFSASRQALRAKWPGLRKIDRNTDQTIWEHALEELEEE